MTDGGDVLHDRDGALPHERDGHWVPAAKDYAVDRPFAHERRSHR